MNRDPHLVRSSRENIANRLLNALSIASPWALMLVLGWVAGWTVRPTAETLWIFAAMSVLTILGVGIGLHRYFTHRSFQTWPLVRVLLAIFGTWAMQGDITRWVADHRRHHRFSDQRFDPHSPWVDDAGPTHNRITGWLHAHIGWMLFGAATRKDRYAADCLADPIVRWFSAWYWPVAVSGLFGPGLIGWALGGEREALLCVFWAGAFRVVLLHQLTWSVNSFGHMFGTRMPGATDQARDNTLLALLLLGEGLHSYHHQFATAAVNRPAWKDPAGWLLLGLRRLGVVWGFRR